MKDLYLVTGAAGHLGLTVVEELRKEGKTVRALVLPGDKAAGKLPAGVEICEGDVLKPASLDAFFAHGDGENLIVIHCAGVVSIASRFIQKVYDVNFKGTQNIVEMCETYGAKKLVYVSSVHAIPELPAGQVMTEIDDFHPADVVGQYVRRAVEMFARQGLVPVIKGNGSRVVRQTPEPGVRWAGKDSAPTSCVLWLSEQE